VSPYVNETVALLAARALKLRKAVRDAKKTGYAYVVLDGTLIPIDRVAVDRAKGLPATTFCISGASHIQGRMPSYDRYKTL
jgi:hypothetical protein